MAVLATVEAAATSAAPTTRLSGLLGLGTVATHVAVLATVEAGSGATATTAASSLPWLLALTAHVAVLAAVEAALAAATTTTTAALSAAALLAPPHTDGPATDAVSVELVDGLLGVVLIVVVDEGKSTL